MKKLKLSQIETIGAVFGIVVGSADHFLYDRTGWIGASVFSPINESPWEHLKLYFFPVMLFMIVEWFFVDDKAKLLFTKTVQVLAGTGFILVFFYGYTTLFHLDSVWVDIGSFIVAMIGGYWLSYRILASDRVPKMPAWPWATALVVIFLVFQLMTWSPPHVPVFFDPPTSTYGILRQP